MEFFKHGANFIWRMNSMKHHHFGHFFIQMWACEAKKRIPENSKAHNYLAIHVVEISEIFSTRSQVIILQDPIVTCVQKCVFFPKFGTCSRNGNFRVFFGENIVKELKGLIFQLV